MKSIPSTVFRRTFPGLTEEVTVTVQGRPIAVYTPGVMHITQRGADQFDDQIALLQKDEEISRLKRELASRPGVPIPEFGLQTQEGSIPPPPQDRD